MNDEDFMRRAIEEAKNSDFPYGAVLVKDGIIMAKSGTAPKDSVDPTAHAEITAIRLACKKLNSKSLEGTTLYSTCEPCPMCFTAAWWANITRIVYGITLEDSSRLLFQELEVSSEFLNNKGGNRILLEGGLLKEDILDLFKK